MSFQIVRNDIALMRVDAIVNTANPWPVVGAGVDFRIHEVAGPKLLAYRQQIGTIAVGGVAISPAYKLNARYVIHVVGPEWDGGDWGEEEMLRRCYEKALTLARKKWCRSIAFPLISTGTYGFPKDRALQIAISVFTEFLTRYNMEIYLVVFDHDSYRLSERLFDGIASYIDQHYVDQLGFYAQSERQIRHRKERALMCESAPMPCMAAPKTNLKDMLKQADAGFSETLLKLIDKSGKKDSEVYKKANMSKQHFSKIRNNSDYKPTKPTAIALALALELDLAETNDLIGRAGFTLSNSSKFDLIIRYFIENRNYNIIEINVALYEFDQSLLGTQ